MSSSVSSGVLDISRKRQLTIYFAIFTSLFMSALDIHIVATALPTIISELGNMELFGWVSGAYILATAVVTPFYGKMADLFGTKKIFIVAIVLFTTGSLACGLAWSMQSLIAARVLQGLGGGGLMTLCFVILAQIFEPRERAKYQGWSMAAISLAGFVGPFVGGTITQLIGWQYIFLLNLPIALLVIGVMVMALPKVEKASRAKIDYVGGVLLALIIIAITFGAEKLAAGQVDDLGILVGGLLVVAIAIFIWVEKKAAEPILPLQFFSNPTIGLALFMSLITGFCTLGLMIYFALLLQTITGLPPAQAGLMFIPSTIGILLSSAWVGSAIAKTGRYKNYVVVSMGMGFVVLSLFSLVGASTPLWMIGILMFSYPLAIGLQNQGLMVAVQNAAQAKDMGAVTGSINLARMIGTSIGLTVNSGLIIAGLASGQEGMSAESVAQLPKDVTQITPDVIATLPTDLASQVVGIFESAFNNVFYFGVGLFAVGFVLSLLLKNVQLPIDGKKA
uniref:MFS transporter n=1 Tax=OCS116 cluster bacterium TaxID=2030921 RepID=A0A2A4Z4V6_9PROT